MLKKLLVVLLIIVSLPFGSASVNAATKKYEAKLSDVDFYYYGYRLPYTLECNGKYYVRVDQFDECNGYDLGGYHANSNVYVIYGAQDISYTFRARQKAPMYNINWTTPVKVGTVIGTVKTYKTLSGLLSESGEYAEKTFKIYSIAGLNYLRIDSLKRKDQKLQYSKELNAYYYGEKPDGVLHEDEIYTWLVAAIKGCKTKKEKLLGMHNYIVKHITYRGPKENHVDADHIMPRNYDLCQQVIADGHGACGDYAAMFVEMCDRMFYPCEIQQNSVHSYNYVYYSGTWYYVDVTWDDRDNNAEIPTTHFLVEPDTFYKTHTSAGVSEAKCSDVRGYSAYVK